MICVRSKSGTKILNRLGDIGSPLICKFDSVSKVVGIAMHQEFFEDFNSDMNPPVLYTKIGQTLSNALYENYFTASAVQNIFDFSSLLIILFTSITAIKT